MKRFVKFAEITLLIIIAIAPVFFEKYIYIYSNITEEIWLLFLIAISVVILLYFSLILRNVNHDFKYSLKKMKST